MPVAEQTETVSVFTAVFERASTFFDAGSVAGRSNAYAFKEYVTCCDGSLLEPIVRLIRFNVPII